MRTIPAGAPTSVAVAACAIATTAACLAALQGAWGDALMAGGLAVAAAHAAASRHAAQVALNAYQGTARIAWEVIAQTMDVSTKLAQAERRVDAMKTELAALPASFVPVPEVANDGR